MSWIQVLTHDGALVRLVEHAVPEEIEVIASTGPPGFSEGAAPSVLVIGGGPRCDAEFVRRNLDLAVRMCLDNRCVLVLPFERRLVAGLNRVGSSALLWWSEAVERLSQVIGELIQDDLRHRLWRALGTRYGDDALLSDAFRETLLAPTPPTSVQGLARLIPCAASTLRDRWRTIGLPGTPLHLVHWAVLSHFAEARQRGLSVAAAKSVLPVDGSTVDRITRRRLACAPGSVTNRKVLASFKAWINAVGE